MVVDEGRVVEENQAVDESLAQEKAGGKPKDQYRTSFFHIVKTANSNEQTLTQINVSTLNEKCYFIADRNRCVVFVVKLTAYQHEN